MKVLEFSILQRIRKTITSVLIGIALTTFVFVVACSHDLGKRDATKQIEDYFHAVAPDVLELLRIDIVEMLSPDENNREVRFRVQFAQMRGVAVLIRDEFAPSR